MARRVLTAAGLTVAAVAALALLALAVDAVDAVDSPGGSPSYGQDEQQEDTTYDTDPQVDLDTAGLDDESVSDDSAEEVGPAICQALDDGTDARAIAGVLVGGGFSIDDTGSVLGLSVAAYCPENASLMLGQLEGG